MGSLLPFSIPKIGPFIVKKSLQLVRKIPLAIEEHEFELCWSACTLIVSINNVLQQYKICTVELHSQRLVDSVNVELWIGYTWTFDWGEGSAPLTSSYSQSAHFGSTYATIGMIQKRLMWPLCKDNTQICEAFHIFPIMSHWGFIYTV